MIQIVCFQIQKLQKVSPFFTSFFNQLVYHFMSLLLQQILVLNFCRQISLCYSRPSCFSPSAGKAESLMFLCSNRDRK